MKCNWLKVLHLISQREWTIDSAVPNQSFEKPSLLNLVCYFGFSALIISPSGSDCFLELI